MKLIVDAQLPNKLCEILNQLGINSIHVDELPEGDETSDSDIIQYADKNDLIVLTKDYDFYHSHMALGRPRRLLLITTGNIKNKQLFELFRNNFIIISKSLEQNHFVELTNDGIIQHE